MMDAPIALILETLSKMAKESEPLTNRNDLISLFCLRVIPFILKHPLLETVRRKWRERRELLQAEAIQAENEAVQAYLEIFHRIKEYLQTHPTRSKPIEDQICLIDHLIAHKSGSYPFSQGLYDAILNLVYRLLNTDFVDVCRQFCEIGKKTTTTPNPKKEPRVFFATENGDCREVHSQEVGDVKENEYFFSLTGVDTVDEYMIDSWHLASFNARVHSTQQALNSNHHHQDAAIVWWYFEHALGLWNTPASYFETTVEPNYPDHAGFNFNLACEKEAWREIVSAKESRSHHGLNIFDDKLFKQGIITLISDITAYFSRFATEAAVLKSIKDEITFELIFDKHEKAKNGSLWISVNTCEGPPKYYHIKKFNSDSLPWQFAQLLLDENPHRGIITVDIDNSNNVSKLIERLGLDGEMRELFFGRSTKNNIDFNGKSVTLKKRAINNLEAILNELLEKHNQCGAPQFSQALVSKK